MTDQELRRRLERIRHHLDLAHDRLLSSEPPLDSIVAAAIQVAIATIEVENAKAQLPAEFHPTDELFA